MSTQWRIIDLSSFEGVLRSERGAIRVCPRDGAEGLVSVADVAVILIGMNVDLSAAVLHRLSESDVAVLFCDWRGVPEGGVYSWSNHGRVGARHRAQAQLSEPRRKSAWARIVRAKVLGQAAVLKTADISGGGELIALARNIRSGDPQNIEAQAARRYWSVFFPGQEGRIPGSGDVSGMNPCLDYGYAILRGYCIRAVLAAGLSGSLGIFHHGRSNVFALADDLIEPFRPTVDDAVLRLGLDASPSDKDVKARLVAAASQTFTPDGRGIQAVAEHFAQQFGQYVEGQLDRLDPPVWQGPLKE